MGCLGYISIRVFNYDSICFSCDNVEWEGDMNIDSLNNSALFGICMCCGSSIYGLTVTRYIMVILQAGINRGVERPCIHGGADILEIWSPYGVFSWWFERLVVGS